MNRKGFTLIELIAVMVVLGLLIVLAIPAYIQVYNQVKRSDYDSKVSVIEDAAVKYGETIKDDVKEKLSNTTYGNDEMAISDKCYTSNDGLSVSTLIKEGYLETENEKDNVLYNPIDNTIMADDKLVLCYCVSDFDVHAFYNIQKFNYQLKYYKGDYVESKGNIYVLKTDYVPKNATVNNKDGINNNTDSNTSVEDASYDLRNVKNNVKYFKKVSCFN